MFRASLWPPKRILKGLPRGNHDLVLHHISSFASLLFYLCNTVILNFKSNSTKSLISLSLSINSNWISFWWSSQWTPVSVLSFYWLTIIGVFIFRSSQEKVAVGCVYFFASSVQYVLLGLLGWLYQSIIRRLVWILDWRQKKVSICLRIQCRYLWIVCVNWDSLHLFEYLQLFF